MKNFTLGSLSILFFLCTFIACSDDSDIKPLEKKLELPAQTLNYVDLNVPEHFDGTLSPQNINALSRNPITNEGATLGRVLFYDTKLSLNNVTACASCHDQSKAFADPVAFSTGFNNKLTSRNSMPIFNNMYTESFFWDMEVDNLEEQVLMPIKDHIEMGIEELSDLEIKLAQIDYYPPLFEAAYGSKEITSDKISKAMAQFIRSIVSHDSKFDRISAGQASFTNLEREGLEVFERAECGNCHVPPTFGGIEAANIGLEMNYADKGVGSITNQSLFNGVFKVPSLRNIELTGPYMHDGRFATLDDVLNHYSEQVLPHQNLDFRLTNAGNGWNDGFPIGDPSRPMHFEFNEHEQVALKAFLSTLTDDKLMTDEKYADPFK